MGLFKKFTEAAGTYFDDYISKAKNSIKAREYELERKALDATDVQDALEVGYRERNFGISFEILRSMSMKDSIIAAIIQTRVAQIKNFAAPQADKYTPGFKIKLRSEEVEATPEDKENMEAIEEWLLNTGDTPDERKLRMDFTDFLGVLTRDLLTYDQVSIELVRTLSGKLSYFLPVSAGSIRYAARRPDKNTVVIESGFATYDKEIQQKEQFLKEKDQDRINDEDYKYVQIYQGRIVRGFYEDELILKMMNPTNELDSNGYSIGPLEMAANVVSYHLFSEAHNKNFFIQGFAGSGIIHIESNISRTNLDAFRKQWKEQFTSVNNSFRTPILASSGKVNWIPLSQSNKDMEWSSWINYLIKLMTALFSIAPQEINFDISSNEKPTLSESGSKNANQFSESKYKGLKPILRFYESIINECLLKNYDQKLYETYKFEFVGDVEDKDQELDRYEKEIKLFKTINEIRAENDLEEIQGGDIILDTNYMQWYNSYSEEAQKKMSDQQSMFGFDMGGGLGGDGPSGSGMDKPKIDNQHPANDLKTQGLGGEKKEMDEVVDKKTTKKSKFEKPNLLKIEWFRK